MKKTVLFFYGLMFPLFLFSQKIPSDVAFRLQQLSYLKKDTLPVDLQLLPKIINSRYSEYKGVMFEDSLFLFTSMKAKSGDDNEDIFEAFWDANIYVSQLTVSGFSDPASLSKKINNSRYYNTNFSFNEKRTEIFFTRCLKTTYPDLVCSIWHSQKEHEKWSTPKLLPKKINFPGTNTTHPHLVEMNDYSILYFSSNRSGGIGEMDLWYSIYKNGHFEEPVNLGDIINTEGNEITPFYDKKTNILYFSSDEHFGIGGYDIFYSQGALSDWAKPTNMGVPFNSEDNDYYFVVNSFDENGYFSSNRPNALYGTSKCCNDLYYYRWKKTSITEHSPSSQQDTLPQLIQEIEMLLPLTLYFDNDQPDPKSTATATDKSYQTLLANYLTRKPVYVKEYSKGLSNLEKMKAEQNIELFFNDSVTTSYYKLLSFIDYLLQILNLGADVTITVAGYASALHKSDYNASLSSRRIDSFINYINDYQENIFNPFLNDKMKNKLQFIQLPMGNQEAIQKNINANLHDMRNSVYSIAASLERRIQIIKIEVTNLLKE